MLLYYDNYKKIVEGCILFRKLFFNFYLQCKVSIEKKINLKIFLKNINVVIGGWVLCCKIYVDLKIKKNFVNILLKNYSIYFKELKDRIYFFKFL